MENLHSCEALFKNLLQTFFRISRGRPRHHANGIVSIAVYFVRIYIIVL